MPAPTPNSVQRFPGEFIYAVPYHPDPTKQIRGYVPISEPWFTGSGPGREVDWFDDFTYGNCQQGLLVASIDPVPVGMWSASSGTGGATGGTIAPATFGIGSGEACTGVVQIGTGTTATGRLSLFQTGFKFGFQRMHCVWRVGIPILSTAGQEYTFVCGFSDNINTATIDATSMGAWWMYDRARFGDFWVAAWRDNVGTLQTVVTTQAVVPGVFITLEVEVAASAAIHYYRADDEIETAFGTALSGAVVGGLGARILKSAGTTERIAYVDYACYSQTRAAR